MSKTNIRVLGIDPGYERVGIAVMEKDIPGNTLLYSECFLTPKNKLFPARLKMVGDRIEQTINTYSPKAIALETLFFTNNQKTAMHVAEVRGVILFMAEKHNLSIFEYTPPQIKVAVTGYGKSDKRAVEEMLQRLVKKIPGKAKDDEYDAIAVALTTLVSERSLDNF